MIYRIITLCRLWLRVINKIAFLIIGTKINKYLIALLSEMILNFISLQQYLIMALHNKFPTIEPTSATAWNLNSIMIHILRDETKMKGLS